MKKAALKKFRNIYRKVAGPQLYFKKCPTQIFSSEYYEISKSTQFEEHLLAAASDFQNSHRTALTLLLSLDNLLTRYEQLSY